MHCTLKVVKGLKLLAKDIRTILKELQQQVQLVAVEASLKALAPPPEVDENVKRAIAAPTEEEEQRLFPVEAVLDEYAGQLTEKAIKTLAEAAGYSRQALEEEVSSTELQADLREMGVDVKAMLGDYGKGLVERFKETKEELLAAQQAMEGRMEERMEERKKELQAMEEHLREEINSRADQQGEESAKMVRLLIGVCASGSVWSMSVC